MLPKHLHRNENELEVIRKLISEGRDRPVLMINENAYTPEAGFPDGDLYQRYVTGLEAVVRATGGSLLWRLPVRGNPLGTAARTDEIIAIWFPSHQAYLDLPKAEGGDQNYILRARCVERALIHRCPGEAFQPSGAAPE